MWKQLARAHLFVFEFSVPFYEHIIFFIFYDRFKIPAYQLINIYES